VYVDDDERPEMVLAEGQATYARFHASVRGKAVTVR
jgi:alpha-D-xyloside xylohydrolase